MRSSAQYVQGQLMFVIGYCKMCGEPITGLPGVKEELCNKHKQNQDEHELQLQLDEYVERMKQSDYKGALNWNIL